MEPLRIAVIVGSTRLNRFSEKPAGWIFREVQKLPDVDAELLDLRDWPLPFMNMSASPSTVQDGNYGSDLVNKWAEKIAANDAFVIVAPEYNHGTSAVLKNALDSLYKEWNTKAVGFVSYGTAGGARAVEHLRLVSIELQMSPVRQAVHIPAAVHFPILSGKAAWTAETEAQFQKSADTMLAQLTALGRVLKEVREGR